MIDLMQTIREQEKRDPSSVETFLSNHPSPADRIALLQRAMPAGAGSATANSSRRFGRG
jgi:predicted Zn-dependent protease